MGSTIDRGGGRVSASRAQEYIESRVEQYRRWYDGRARTCKTWYLRMRVGSLVSASGVSALINVPSRWALPVATALSVVTLILIALDGTLRLRDQWENYRYTEQYIDREKHLYAAGAGPYKDLDPALAFSSFVERIEWAIGAENSTTLATMALAPDARIAGRGRTDY